MGLATKASIHYVIQLKNIKKMNEQLINSLQRAIGVKKVLLGADVSARYEHIWTMNTPLNAMAVVLPSTTEEVSAIMKICYAHNQPVVVHGGLTNLVGSTKTKSNELVISTERLNQIEEIDPSSRTMTVQAGVILETIQQAAKKEDLLFPLNFGAKGSAQIGGIISTNAGGLRVFRYGMTRNLILGLEVVLADGTIISSLKKIIKDNSAYDLKQLFIGTEGTLGIVCKAVLKLVEAPKSRNGAWLGVSSYKKVIQLLKFLDKELAGTLSGFELVWQSAFKALTSPPASVKSPLPYDYPYYVLVETLGGNQQKDLERLQELLETAMTDNLIADAAIAFTNSDLEWFWQIREDVHVMIGACQNNQQYDISIPIPKIGKYVEKSIKKLYKIPEINLVFTLGHVADGNIHFSIGKTRQSKKLIHQINKIIYKPLKKLGGSISAEHGIGLDKKAYLKLSRSPEEIALMETLKRSMDSKGLLNRGKVLG